ncbi:3-hydroxyisobutyrate dehydrogenase-like protein [Bisporella sp. PMI_857]|nr:3-hydroxyisobutyrate dehydrogenase-like protein [Bisporella sp. PMI_857]
MRVNARISASMARSLRITGQRRTFSSSLGRQAQYGFIGLGQMGYNMARNLQAKLASTDTLHVYDINTVSAEKFVRETKALSAGAVVELASSVREAAENSEIVISCLPEPAHVKAVFGQILTPSPLSTEAVSSPERLFIDCSTIDPASSRAVADHVHTLQQGRFVDAPMSGGVVGATAGTLTFMLGAPEALVSRIEPILLKMGKRVLHCGPQGAGLAGKLANNYLLAINNIATAEAMNLGIRGGLEPKVLGNLINISTGRCWPSEINNPVKGVVEGAPASRDYNGGFGISLMRKDLNLAIQAAGEAGARLELGDRAREVYESAEQQEDCKGKDFSVVFRYLGGESAISK